MTRNKMFDGMYVYFLKYLKINLFLWKNIRKYIPCHPIITAMMTREKEQKIFTPSPDLTPSVPPLFFSFATWKAQLPPMSQSKYIEDMICIQPIC